MKSIYSDFKQAWASRAQVWGLCLNPTQLQDIKAFMAGPGPAPTPASCFWLTQSIPLTQQVKVEAGENKCGKTYRHLHRVFGCSGVLAFPSKLFWLCGLSPNASFFPHFSPGAGLVLVELSLSVELDFALEQRLSWSINHWVQKSPRGAAGNQNAGAVGRPFRKDDIWAICSVLTPRSTGRKASWFNEPCDN